MNFLNLVKSSYHIHDVNMDTLINSQDDIRCLLYM